MQRVPIYTAGAQQATSTHLFKPHGSQLVHLVLRQVGLAVSGDDDVPGAHCVVRLVFDADWDGGDQEARVVACHDVLVFPHHAADIEAEPAAQHARHGNGV